MRVMKYLTVLSFLVVMSFGLYACDDPNNGRVGPRGNMQLAPSWGTTLRDSPENIAIRLQGGAADYAKFQHDDHDDKRACAECHGNDAGGKISITNRAGATVKDKAHDFCWSCHRGVRDAPQEKNCFECHKLPNYNGGY